MAFIINEPFKSDIKTLKQHKFRVKPSYGRVNENSDHICVSYKANKRFVSIRCRERYSYHGSTVLGYSVFSRNKNGGYVKRQEFSALEGALDLALSILSTEEEPEIPDWSKSSLPTPMGFSDKLRYEHHKYANSTIIGISFQSLITHIEAKSLVAIDKDCTVSAEAIKRDNNDPWVLMYCRGTGGRFSIISNGEEWYPVQRTTHNRMKISLDTKVGNIDLAHMNASDKHRIGIAFKMYLERLAAHTSGQ